MDKATNREIALGLAAQTDFHLDVNNLLTAAYKILDFLEGVDEGKATPKTEVKYEPFDLEKVKDLFASIR